MTLAAAVTMVGSPALTREGTPTVLAIARGSDRRFYVRKWSQYAQTHGAGSFEPIAGTWTSDPAIASPGADALNVVGLGTDGNVWHAHRIGATPWIVSEFLGRPIASQSVSAPALVWTDDRLSVLVVSAGALYERYYSRQINAWHASGWKKIASGFTGKPAAVSWGGTRIDTFLVGDDDQVYQVAYVNGSGCHRLRLAGGQRQAPARPWRATAATSSTCTSSGPTVSSGRSRGRRSGAAGTPSADFQRGARPP